MCSYSCQKETTERNPNDPQVPRHQRLRQARRLDLDEKGTRSVRTPGGIQEVSVINESGLYSAILGSKVEGAKAFRRWVTSEVLPSIRKHT